MLNGMSSCVLFWKKCKFREAVSYVIVCVVRYDHILYKRKFLKITHCFLFEFLYSKKYLFIGDTASSKTSSASKIMMPILTLAMPLGSSVAYHDISWTRQV